MSVPWSQSPSNLRLIRAIVKTSGVLPSGCVGTTIGRQASQRTCALSVFTAAMALLAIACGGGDEPGDAVPPVAPPPITSPAPSPPVPSPAPPALVPSPTAVPSGGGEDVETVLAPAPIEGVEIEFSAGPGQSNLVVVSGLPNACWSPGPYTVSSTADRIHAIVENEGRVGPEVMCAEIYRTVTTRIPVATELEACRAYDVVVNGEAYQVQALASNIRCTASGAATEAGPRVGQQLNLALGDTVRFEDEGLRIGFLDVEQDSRCPSDVTCIDAGRATIVMDAAHDESRLLGAVNLTLRAGEVEASAVDFQGFTIQLLSLEPYPVSTKRTELEDYVATVVVTESEAP